MFDIILYWQLEGKKTTTNIRISERVAGRLCLLMFDAVLYWQLVLNKTMTDFVIIGEDL
jgi:hypothetical protein